VQIQNMGSSKGEYLAVVSGSFRRANWSLVINDSIRTTSDFKVYLPITSRVTEVHFVALGPLGEKQEQTLAIIYENLGVAKKNKPTPIGQHWNLGLGYTHVTLTETGLGTFSEGAITPKISYRLGLSQSWDFVANTFFTAFPIATQPSGEGMRFYGINARAEYKIPIVQYPWAIGIAVGGYFATMSTSGSQFGYRNLFGPQVFPTLRRNFGPNNSLSIYAKYSPVQQSSLFDFSSHEVATGIGYTRILPNVHPLSLVLDYSRISVVVTPSYVVGTSYSMSFIYGLF